MNVLKILSRLFGLFAVAATVGCVANGPKFTGPKAAHEDSALLYVFRPFGVPWACTPAILVNGVRVAKLANQGFFDLELQPGEYQITADWSWDCDPHDTSVNLRVERGRTYYVGIFSDTGMAFATYHSDAAIGQVDSEQGATAMAAASCREIKKLPGVEDLVRPK